MAAATNGGTTGMDGATGSRANVLGAGGTTASGASRLGVDAEGATVETGGVAGVGCGFRTAGCGGTGGAAGMGLDATAGAGKGEAAG